MFDKTNMGIESQSAVAGPYGEFGKAGGHQSSLTTNGEGYQRDLLGDLHGQIAHAGTR